MWPQFKSHRTWRLVCGCYRCLGFTTYPLTKVRDISEMPLSIQLLNDFSQPLGRLVHSSSRNRRATRPLRICCAKQHGGSSTSSENGATQTPARNSGTKKNSRNRNSNIIATGLRPWTQLFYRAAATRCPESWRYKWKKRNNWKRFNTTITEFSVIETFL